MYYGGIYYNNIFSNLEVKKYIDTRVKKLLK